MRRLILHKSGSPKTSGYCSFNGTHPLANLILLSDSFGFRENCFKSGSEPMIPYSVEP